VTVTALRAPFQLQFRALKITTLGEPYGDIAVDEVRMRAGSCGGVAPTTTPTAATMTTPLITTTSVATTPAPTGGPGPAVSAFPGKAFIEM
jgi:hypothetical protein